MPGMHDGAPDGFGAHHFGGAWGFAPLLFVGAVMVWLLAPTLITAGYLWYRSRRARRVAQSQPEPLIADEPSAFELLRRRYVVGEIDARAFEEMTGRLLVSEHVEERQTPRLAAYDRYLRREPETTEVGPVWV